MDAIETFARMEGGQFLKELADQLYEVSERVIKKAAKTGRAEKGKVTVSFEVVKAPGIEPTVMFVPSIDQKFPKKEPAGSVVFAMDGAFHSRDPRQAAFDVRVVDMSTGEIRDVAQEEPAPARETTVE